MLGLLRLSDRLRFIFRQAIPFFSNLTNPLNYSIKSTRSHFVSLPHSLFKLWISFMLFVAINMVCAAVHEKNDLQIQDLHDGEMGQIQQAAQACRFVQSDFSTLQEGESVVPVEYGKLAKYTIFKKIDKDNPITAIAFLSPKSNTKGQNGRDLFIAFQGANPNNYQCLISSSSPPVSWHENTNRFNNDDNELSLWCSALINANFEVNSEEMLFDSTARKMSSQLLKGSALWALSFTKNSINEAQKKYGQNNIRVIACGHALGGIYAQIIGLYGHHPIYIFNSPGVKGLLVDWGQNLFADLGHSSSNRSFDGLNILLGGDKIGKYGESFVQTKQLPYWKRTDSFLDEGLSEIKLKYINRYIDRKKRSIEKSLRDLDEKIEPVRRLSRRDEDFKLSALRDRSLRCDQSIVQYQQDQYTECKINNCKNNWVFHTQRCKQLEELIKEEENSKLNLLKDIDQAVALINKINSLPYWQQEYKELSEKLIQLNSFERPIRVSALTHINNQLVRLGYDYINDRDFGNEELINEQEAYTLLRQHSIEAICDVIEGKIPKTN